MTKPNDKVLRLAAAQITRTLAINGHSYQRISYGGSDGVGETCCVCGATRGQLHAVGCLVERCPVCRVEQLGFCDCSKRP
jgi:hypothetical protein